MDFDDTPEQAALRAAAAALGRKYGREYYIAKAKSGGHTSELWAEAGKLGYLGANLPVEYGGAGGGLTELAIVGEELAAAGCPLLLIVVSPAIAGTVIARHGTEEQRRAYLPGIAGGDNADFVLVVARTTDEATGKLKPALFLVPTDAPGLSKSQLEMEIVAAERQFLLYLDDVRVPADALVGESTDAGLPALFAGLNPERVTIAAMSCGSARYALSRAAEYAATRSVWGRPIGTHQGVAHPLAHAHIQVELARLMVAKAAACYDAGRDVAAGTAANMAKYAAADAAALAVDTAIQAMGGNGMTTEYGVATLLGVTRATLIAPVSREMILNFVAQHVLGQDRSY